MTATLDLPQDLIDRVRALSPAQQAALRAALPAPAPGGDPELKALLTQRWEDYQSGKMKSLSFEESDERIRQVLEEFER